MDTIRDEAEKGPLICSTDREDCCTDSNIDEYWFLPSGSKVQSTNRQSLYMSLGNQTVGLTATNNLEIPSGIYHCEMMDEKNVIHYLYAGIYHTDEGS